MAIAIQAFIALIICALSVASPLQHRGTSHAPSVIVKNGTIVGTTSSNGTIESFKGIPFAQPPISNLRLKPPTSVNTKYPSGTLVATSTPTACPQQPGGVKPSTLPKELITLTKNNSVAQAIFKSLNTKLSPEGEDCLTLNVQRPANVSSNDRLPILLYIYGGGFENGASLSYDGSYVIAKSVALGKPIVYVAINYRLNAFGFLGGKQLQQDRSTNLGLRDQRLALQWVQENIAAFGGDPSRVTIMGNSAGAWSVFDHLVINNGDISYGPNGGQLFHGAIMDSGNAFPALPVNSTTAQNVYDTVAHASGCNNAENSLECLRGVEFKTLLKAANTLPNLSGYRSLDVAYVARPDPEDEFLPTNPYQAIKDGKFARVPVMINDQEDEGTLFSVTQKNITNSAQLTQYLASYFPETNQTLVQEYVDTYPTAAAAGAPFGTGQKYQLYPEFKRLSAILGDYAFTLSRRIVLTEMASRLPAAYSGLASYFNDVPALGTLHGSDVLIFFFNAGPKAAVDTVSNYYISFITSYDPNNIKTNESLTTWPKYSTKGLNMVNLTATGSSVIRDDFRHKQYEFLKKHRFQFAI